MVNTLDICMNYKKNFFLEKRFIQIKQCVNLRMCRMSTLSPILITHTYEVKLKSRE